MKKTKNYKQCSSYIGMEFCIEKCTMLIMKEGEKRNNGRDRTAKAGKQQNS